ncbi:MAG: BACON domain-containing protein [Prevotella sp.]|nr:BACON domain-containing protein [Prevotella sp.]
MVTFVACGDDDSGYMPSDYYRLEVVEANVTFGPDAETGRIVVNTDQDITATSSEDWCTVSVNGSTVYVSVEDFSEITSRNAEVTIKSGVKSVQVPVHQNGVVFALDAPSELVFDNSEVSVKYAMKTNAELIFSTSADWISINPGTDNLEISLSENTTGHMRNAYIYYQKGDMTGSVKVVQCDFDTDIAGKIFYFAGLDLSEEEDVLISEYARFVKDDEGNYFLNFFQYGWNVPVTLASPTEAQISLSNNIGTYSVYTIGFVGWDLDQGYISWNSSVSISAKFYYDDENEVTMANIEDNGSWNGYEISGIRFEAWNAAGSRLGYLEAIGWPFMQEYVPSNATSRSIKQKAFKLNTKPVKVK